MNPSKDDMLEEALYEKRTLEWQCDRLKSQLNKSEDARRKAEGRVKELKEQLNARRVREEQIWELNEEIDRLQRKLAKAIEETRLKDQLSGREFKEPDSKESTPRTARSTFSQWQPVDEEEIKKYLNKCSKTVPNPPNQIPQVISRDAEEEEEELLIHSDFSEVQNSRPDPTDEFLSLINRLTESTRILKEKKDSLEIPSTGTFPECPDLNLHLESVHRFASSVRSSLCKK